MCNCGKMSQVEADFRALLRVDQIRVRSAKTDAKSIEHAKLIELAMNFELQEKQRRKLKSLGTLDEQRCSLADVNRVLLETHPIVQELLRTQTQPISATEVRQVREITLDAEGGVHYKDLEL